jgi:hypothetical protein
VGAAGNISRIVPIKIKSANPIITVRAGDRIMDFEIRMEIFLALNLIKTVLMGVLDDYLSNITEDSLP